jgi:hypothetical protein
MRKESISLVALGILIITVSALMIYWFSGTSGQLQLQVSDLKQANIELETKVSELEKKVANTSTPYEQLQLEISEVMKANEALELKISELETSIEGMSTSDDQLQLQISELRQANSDLQAKIASKIATITGADGFEYSLGTTGAILSIPSIPQFVGAGSAPSGFLQEGYLTVALSQEKVATSAAFFPESIGYGTYEWKGKCAGIGTVRFIGWGFHKFYRQSSDGIEIYYDKYLSGKWFLWTSRDGTFSQNEIVGVDFTIQHKFTLEWTTAYVRLSIDNVLVAQNVVGIPNIRLYPFQEITIEQPGAEDAYVYSKDWQKIA